MYPIRPATQADAALIKKMVVDAGINPTRLKWENFIVVESDENVIESVTLTFDFFEMV